MKSLMILFRYWESICFTERTNTNKWKRTGTNTLNELTIDRRVVEDSELILQSIDDHQLENGDSNRMVDEQVAIKDLITVYICFDTQQ